MSAASASARASAAAASTKEFLKRSFNPLSDSKVATRGGILWAYCGSPLVFDAYLVLGPLLGLINVFDIISLTLNYVILMVAYSLIRKEAKTRLDAGEASYYITQGADGVDRVDGSRCMAVAMAFYWAVRAILAVGIRTFGCGLFEAGGLLSGQQASATAATPAVSGESIASLRAMMRAGGADDDAASFASIASAR